MPRGLGKITLAVLELFKTRRFLYVAHVLREMPHLNEAQARHAIKALKNAGHIKNAGRQRSPGMGAPQRLYTLSDKLRNAQKVAAPDPQRPSPVQPKIPIDPLAAHRDRKIELIRRLIDKSSPGTDRDLLIGILRDYKKA